MPLSSSQLEAFLAVARAGRFTEAARRLGLTQSALSQRIAQLEEELETTLFVRERSGTSPTEAGRDLLRYCQAKENLEAELTATLRSGSREELAGILRIGAYSSVMNSVILPALGPLLSLHPKLRLHCFTRELRELPNLFRRGEVDFVVLDHSAEADRWVAHPLGEERYVLAARKSGTVPNVYLDHDERDLTTTRYLRMRGNKRDSAVASSTARHFVDDVAGILAGVELGLGQAVLPLHLVRRSRSVRVLHPGSVLRVPVVLHHREQAYYSRTHLAVVAALREGCPKFLTD